jgi:hypothetical protein
MSPKGVLGIVGGIVLLMAVAYYAMPNPGRKALVREEIAVNGVSSWRIHTEISVNGRVMVSRTHVAECPDRERIMERGMDNYAEYARLGNDIYYRKGNLKWVKGTPGPDLFTPFPSPRPCLSNPNEPSSNPPGGAEEIKQWIETDIKDGRISKGEIQDFKGQKCQEWSVSRFTSQNQLGSYNVCLRESDGLPVYWKSYNERLGIYFEWDPTIRIQPPDMNASGIELPETP